ncbi:hypothetical protein FRB91_007237, partial [Serendipita sp. 411]
SWRPVGVCGGGREEERKEERERKEKGVGGESKVVVVRKEIGIQPKEVNRRSSDDLLSQQQRQDAEISGSHVNVFKQTPQDGVVARSDERPGRVDVSNHLKTVTA